MLKTKISKTLKLLIQMSAVVGGGNCGRPQNVTQILDVRLCEVSNE